MHGMRHAWPALEQVLPYQNLGCWQDTTDLSSRLNLAVPLVIQGSRTMTPDECYRQALSMGGTVFAIKWSMDCHVGASLTDAQKFGRAPAGACNYNCVGTWTDNASRGLCGGSTSVMTLYTVRPHPPASRLLLSDHSSCSA